MISVSNERELREMGLAIDPANPHKAIRLPATATPIGYCKKCKKPVNSLVCGHCGTRLSPEQTADLQAVWRAWAKTKEGNGHAAKTVHKGRSADGHYPWEYRGGDTGSGELIVALRALLDMLPSYTLPDNKEDIAELRAAIRELRAALGTIEKTSLRE
jgi:hypothetical protein